MQLFRGVSEICHSRRRIVAAIISRLRIPKSLPSLSRATRGPVRMRLVSVRFQSETPTETLPNIKRRLTIPAILRSWSMLRPNIWWTGPLPNKTEYLDLLDMLEVALSDMMLRWFDGIPAEV